MIYEKSFKFNYRNYKNGWKINSDELFTDFINKCERKFLESSNIVYANFFFANKKTMNIIKDCSFDTNHTIGIQLITGDLELDEYLNNQMDNYCKKERIYAIGCERDDDEPLWLIIDDNIKDGKFILKYISDDEIDNRPLWLITDNDKGGKTIIKYLPVDESEDDNKEQNKSIYGKLLDQVINLD